jgi:hypothetical protein
MFRFNTIRLVILFLLLTLAACVLAAEEDDFMLYSVRKGNRRLQQEDQRILAPKSAKGMWKRLVGYPRNRNTKT